MLCDNVYGLLFSVEHRWELHFKEDDSIWCLIELVILVKKKEKSEASPPEFDPTRGKIIANFSDSSVVFTREKNPQVVNRLFTNKKSIRKHFQ